MAEPDLVQDVLKPQSGFCLHGVQGREPFDLKMKGFSALNTMKAKSRLRFQYILDKIRFSHVG